MGLVEEICNKLNSSQCIVEKCKKESCSVSMKGIPKTRVIVDLDKKGSPMSRHESRCDYLVAVDKFKNSGLVCLLELKSGKPDVSKAQKQLQSTADKIVSWLPQITELQFVFTLAYKGMAKFEQREMKKKIQFRGTSYRITRIRCGKPLQEVF